VKVQVLDGGMAPPVSAPRSAPPARKKPHSRKNLHFNQDKIIDLLKIFTIVV
jgi:hypothetical protein